MNNHPQDHTPNTACIVRPGKDGATLWDCECPECQHIVALWHRFGPVIPNEQPPTPYVETPVAKRARLNLEAQGITIEELPAMDDDAS